MNLAKAVKALVVAGATPEMILALVETEEAEREAQAAQRRAKNAERQRRHRMSRDVTVTRCDTPSQSEEQFLLSEPSECNQTLPPISPKIPSKVVSMEFERFWGACPRKVGKGSARTAYARALRKADSPAILAGLERAKLTWTELEPQYVPHPATWLNQERWLDEPDDNSRETRVVYNPDFAAQALEFAKKAGLNV